MLLLVLLLISVILHCGSATSDVRDGPAAFLDLALRATHPYKVDKVKEHAYQEMYGTFLLPHIDSVRDAGRGFRFMEIGLGCSIPAKKKGIDLWNALFHLADAPSTSSGSGSGSGRHLRRATEYEQESALTSTAVADVVWIAELKQKCVQKMINSGHIPGKLHNQFIYGDQGDEGTLQQWVHSTGGAFDAIVDDGSHRNDHIFTSLLYLWKHALAPGGMYFIEDLQVGRHRDFMRPNGVDIDRGSGSGSGSESSSGSDGSKPVLLMVEVLKDWVEQLVIPLEQDRSEGRWRYPLTLLPGIKSIYCQAEACVLFKCKERDVARCYY